MDRKYFLNLYLPEFQKELNALSRTKGTHSHLVGFPTHKEYDDIFEWIIRLCTDESFMGDVPDLSELEARIMYDHRIFNGDILKVFKAIFLDMQMVLDCSLKEVPLHINGIPPVKAIVMGRLRLGI